MAEYKQQRLVREAEMLKKTWILTMAMHGAPRGGKEMESEFKIPQYSFFENGFLKRHIRDIEDDIREIAKKILIRKSLQRSSYKWCAQKFEDWHRSGSHIFVLGTIYEVESELGPLALRRRIECPPYAQVLLQGFSSAAVRHPEYHLARDIEFLWNLFFDEYRQCAENLRRGEPTHTERMQSLGRSVIIACFNLLESFVSGLTTEWRILNPTVAATTKLPDEMSPLKKRFFAIPAAITGKPNLIDQNSPLFVELFDDLKKRRDSFVHCEPGQKITKLGYIKEEQFHAIDHNVVERAVRLTIAAITHVWKAVHNRDGPRWLPSFDDGGNLCRNTIGH